MHPLVSIITPNYNRASIICETLKSIANQTYKNWECLIIDDCSSDNSLQVINTFIKGEKRFKLFVRPKDKPKGANVCRNIGLDKATGDFIIFFDSDDLMADDHIKIKLKAIQSDDYDYVITQSRFINNEKGNIVLEKQYDFETKDISSFNYISHKINWLTCDSMIKSNVAKSLSFNESLSSGQEYNYFCNLVLVSTNAIFIEDVVTRLRYHDNSIRGKLRQNKIKQTQGYLIVYWLTYLDTTSKTAKKTKRFLMYRCYRLLGKLPAKKRLFEKKILKALIKEFGAKGFYYLIKIYSKRIT